MPLFILRIVYIGVLVGLRPLRKSGTCKSRSEPRFYLFLSDLLQSFRYFPHYRYLLVTSHSGAPLTNWHLWVGLTCWMHPPPRLAIQALRRSNSTGFGFHYSRVQNPGAQHEWAPYFGTHLRSVFRWLRVRPAAGQARAAPALSAFYSSGMMQNSKVSISGIPSFRESRFYSWSYPSHCWSLASFHWFW